MNSRIPLFLAGIIAGACGLAGVRHLARPRPSQPGLPAAVPIASSAPSDEAVVTMPAAKRRAAGIEVGEVVQREMRVTRTVPGRLLYDDRRHIQIKLPTAGILTEILVKPGDAVEASQVLAIVSSSEVGTARADALKRQADLDVARREFAWKKAACDGVKTLVAAVRAGESPETISTRIQDVKLGLYRASILEAYSRYRLAKSLTDELAGLTARGAIPGRTAQQRYSETESALAALQTQLEQSSYSADRECAAAETAVADAMRRLQISQQHLNTLVGYEDTLSSNHSDRDLSLVDVRTPFAGTIEERLLSAAERVEQNAALLVLADTSTLWVAANVREREWQALRLAEGQSLIVTTPAFVDQRLDATVHYIGREVDPQTNAVPLIASIDNRSGMLRPGQFARVELPLGDPRTTLAVPQTAVVEHDSHAFVFLAESDDRFRRVDVELGIQDGRWAEVIEGLKVGDPIVTAGAFYLKSELLLEGDE